MRYTSADYTEDLSGIGKGWHKLVIPLIDLADLYGCKINQVKEKFGGLCFYLGSSEQGDKIPYLQLVIDSVCNRSLRTCEDCGEDGVAKWGHSEGGRRWPIYKVTTEPVNPGGFWIKSLCKPCRDKRAEKKD